MFFSFEIFLRFHSLGTASTCLVYQVPPILLKEGEVWDIGRKFFPCRGWWDGISRKSVTAPSLEMAKVEPGIM